jgi:hypothetical protein
MATQTAHIADVMAVLRDRISALDSVFENMAVEVGNPAQFHPRLSSEPLVTLFLYRIAPDHAAFLSRPDAGLAVRLHVAITVYCAASEEEGESAGTKELRILSSIARIFMETPRIGPIPIRDVAPIGPLALLTANDLFVEMHLLSPDMEEVNHIWTTQADTPYRTSLVYEVSFGFVTPSRLADEGPPVLAAAGRVEATAPGAPPASPDQRIDVSATGAARAGYAAITLNTGTPAAPVLVSTVSARLSDGPSLAVQLVAVAETAEQLDLSLERFETTSGLWQEASASLSTASVTGTARAIAAAALTGGGALPATALVIDAPAAPAVMRLRARHASDPESLIIAPVHVSFEEDGDGG